MNSKLSSLALLALSFFIFGCVAKGMHDETLAQNIRMSSQLSDATKELNQVKAQLEECRKKMSELEARNEELSNTNQMLVGKNSEFARKSAESQQELIKVKQEKTKPEEKSEGTSKAHEELVKMLKNEISEGEVKIARKGDRILIDLPDQILFSAGSEKLQPSGKKVLNKMADILRDAQDQRVEVGGHTDNLAVTGALKKKFATNWELSAAHAAQVVRYFEDSGVDPLRLASIGYGENHPVAPNNTPAGRKLNRRVEIVIVPIKPNAN